MTSNLLIGYPTIPLNATLSLVSGSADTLYPLANISTGDRGKIFRLASAANETEIKMDLGASSTGSASFLYVARANLLLAQKATKLTLRSSPDDVTYTDIIGTNTGVQTRTYTGPDSEDLMFVTGFNDEIAASLPSTARRYHRLKFGDASVSAKWNFSKVMCGEFFDFGRDPVAPVTINRIRESPSARRAGYSLSVEWQGLTDASIQSFMNLIWGIADVSPVVLWDSQNVLLYGMRSLHCAIVSAERSRTKKGVNGLKVRFEELI